MTEAEDVVLTVFDDGSKVLDATLYHRRLFDRWQQEQGYNARSIPGRIIDLYSDCLGRHGLENRAALRSYQGGALLTISYGELLTEVRRCAECWHAHGVNAQESVAVLVSSPFERTVALLAGFRLGLQVSLLPVTGASLLAEHLALLDCDHLHIESGFMNWVPVALRSQVIRQDQRRALENEEPRVYGPTDIALRLIDPGSESGQSVVIFQAGFLFRRLLQDAYLILNIDRGQLIAGMSRVEEGTAPFPELSALLAGACFWFIEPPDWQQHAVTLLAEPLDLISIPAHARSALTAPGIVVEEGTWKRWVRNPVECLDYAAWCAFAKRLGLESIPHADLLVMTSMAGIALGNDWSVDLLNMDVAPPAGQDWHLGDLMDPTQPSPTQHGRFAVILPDFEAQPVIATPVLLTSFGKGYRFVGHYPPGRQGRAVPAAQMIQVLKITGARHAIVEKPGGQGVDSKTDYVLIAFRDPRSEDEILQTLAGHLGLSARPDAIVRSSLYPRLTEKGEVDSGWVSQLYFRGELSRREEAPFYGAIARFKAEVYRHLEGDLS